MKNMRYFLLVVFLSSACGIFLPSYEVEKSLIMSYNWPEPDGKIKRFPHENNCHFYYQDEGNDLFTIRRCDQGKIFDYHKHECAEKSNGQCFSDHYGKTKIHDHIHSKIRKLFKCRSSDGNFPDIFDCKKYFHCKNGEPKHRQCHSNKYFDKLKKHCVFRKDALCADISDVSKNGKTDYKCPRRHGAFADPKACSHFYKCLHGKPNLRICETGKLFDTTTKRCITKESVDCGNRFNPYEYNNKDDFSTTYGSSLSETETSTEISSLEKTIKERNEVTATNNKPTSITNEAFYNISSTLNSIDNSSTIDSSKASSTEISSSDSSIMISNSVPSTTILSNPSSTTSNDLPSTTENIPSTSASNQSNKRTTNVPRSELTEIISTSVNPSG